MFAKTIKKPIIIFLITIFLTLFTSACDNEQSQILFNKYPFSTETLNSTSNIFKTNDRIYYLVTLPKPVTTKKLYIQIVKTGGKTIAGDSADRLGYDLVWTKRVKLKDEQMKLINPSVELIAQTPGLEGIYKQVERVGRVCYKSEDKITEDSAKPFVERMVKMQHYAMLEHGTVYLAAPYNNEDLLFWKVANSPYSKGVCDDKSNLLCLTTNLRVIAELNAWEVIDKYLCEPTESHAKRICLKFITSIGVSREFNRHRTASIAEQSTRYCNYSKEKFGGEVTFVMPSWLNFKEGSYNQSDYDKDFYTNDSPEYSYMIHLLTAEATYLKLINDGWQPQQARETLPLATATEVVYTAFEDDWEHFFDLRYRGTTGLPHPNAKQVATMAHDLIIKELGKDL